MTGLERYPAVNAFGSFIEAPDSVYGTGSDGSATISANTSLTSDKFYYNLSIDSNIVLNTAGYRLFVKNLLTLSSNSTIGVGTSGVYSMTTGFSGVGTIRGGGGISGAVTTSLGGNSATQSAVVPTAAEGGLTYWNQPVQAVRGYALNASSATPTFLYGGAGGSSGVGGGVVIIAARYISATSANIKATGATGANGGGGGVIILVSTYAAVPSEITTNVTGGTSCVAGTVIYSQLI